MTVPTRVLRYLSVFAVASIIAVSPPGAQEDKPPASLRPLPATAPRRTGWCRLAKR
ncbi:MAG: hypothetical protein WBO69_15550 [Thermoanaerobaculia bacterium]